MSLGGIETTDRDASSTVNDDSPSPLTSEIFTDSASFDSTASQSDASFSCSRTTAKESDRDRRAKLSSLLSDQGRKTLQPKVSNESQQLHCMKEDLALKRKLCEREDIMDKEFLQHSSKMVRTMENVANAMSGCLQLMTAMFHTQMQNPNVAFSSVPPFMQMPNDQRYQQAWVRRYQTQEAQAHDEESQEESYLTI